MQISLNLSAYGAASARYSQSKNEAQTGANPLLQPQNLKDVSQLKQSASKLSAREISNGYFAQFQAQAFSQANSSTMAQSALDAIFSGSNFKAPGNLSEILGGLDYAAMGYEGKAIGELNKDEASELIGENGFFGINNTADRIANFIVNAASGEYVNMFEAGIIDPVKVERVALQNAVSVASLLLTTEATISEIKEDKALPAMPDMGGMGGMGGMM